LLGLQRSDSAPVKLGVAFVTLINAKLMSFTESMAKERAKQKELKKSKEERCNALCEEL
jgi:hypothetical protein